MTNKELELLYNVSFDAKMWAEDAIELARNGHPHGYKKGFVEQKLRDADKAIALIESMQK